MIIRSFVRTNRFWIIVLVCLVAGSLVAVFLLRRGTADMAYVYLDGEVVRRVELSAVAEPFTFIVEAETGMNVIAVENGRIRVLDADCPDGSCIRQGWVSGGAAPIVCLPHRLIIKPERNDLPNIDAVA